MNEDEQLEDLELNQEDPVGDPPVPEIYDDDRPLTVGEARRLLEMSQQNNRQPAPQQEQTVSDAIYNPAYEARQALRVIDSMIADVRKQNPDVPIEVVNGLQALLDKEEDFDRLVTLQKTGQHLRYADSEMMKMVREGKYTPSQFRGAQASRGAGGGASVRPVQPTRTLREMEAFPGEEAMVKNMLGNMGTKYELDSDDINYLTAGGTPLK